jgi:Ca2+-binding RTX toxin-like protein
MSARSNSRKFNKKISDQNDTGTTSAGVNMDPAIVGSENVNKFAQKMQERSQQGERRGDGDRGGGEDNRDRGGEDRDDGNESGGTATADTLLGRSGGDDLRGGGGNDTLVDSGGVPGAGGKDTFKGGEGADQIHTHWGLDRVRGGAGDDVIYSRSDAGEPMIARPNGAAAGGAPGAALTPGQPFDKNSTNDRLSGGAGADKFVFRIDINAVASILAKHTNDAGMVDWEKVTGENGTNGVPSHLHWVEAFGTDIIKDFSKSDGDKITITGHTTDIADADAITYSDFNGDGKMDTIIKVISQQGANGTHDEDLLGKIVVLGDGTDNTKLTRDDIGTTIQINANAHHGMFDSLEDINPDWQISNLQDPAQNLANVQFGTRGSDTINGDEAANVLVDRGEWKDRANADVFNGNGGDDKIRTHWGKDTVDGGAGNDLIVSRSDAGEPVIAEPRAGEPRVYNNQPFSAAVTDDMLKGGAGTDTFLFRLDLNAKASIIAKHIHDFSENHDHGDHDYSNIDWEGVTGENTLKHDHWLEGIGNDTIADYEAGEKIRIEGHTVNIREVRAQDVTTLANGDTQTTLRVYSNQGAGAHNEDDLGTITVIGDAVNVAADVAVDANVHYGAFSNIDEITFV